MNGTPPNGLSVEMRDYLAHLAEHKTTNLVTPLSTDVSRLSITVDRHERLLTGNGKDGIITQLALGERRMEAIERDLKEGHEEVMRELKRMSERPQPESWWSKDTVRLVAIVLAAILGAGGAGLGASQLEHDRQTAAEIAREVARELAHERAIPRRDKSDEAR